MFENFYFKYLKYLVPTNFKILILLLKYFTRMYIKTFYSLKAFINIQVFVKLIKNVI